MRFVEWLTPSPVTAYGERTMMYVPQRDASQPNSFLIELATKAIDRAQDISLSDIVSRQVSMAANPAEHPDVWPGEHYRLLAAIVEVLQLRTIVEIGTYQGLSALALKMFLPTGFGHWTGTGVVDWNPNAKS